MCTTTTCRSCGKTTWSGCGRHVDAVMGPVAQKDRCICERPQRKLFDLKALLGR